MGAKLQRERQQGTRKSHQEDSIDIFCSDTFNCIALVIILGGNSETDRSKHISSHFWRMYCFGTFILFFFFLGPVFSRKVTPGGVRGTFSNLALRFGHLSGIGPQLACFAITGMAVMAPLPGTDSLVWAEDKSKSALVYKSGKSPVQEDPNDPKVGSKKEKRFLKCISSCKSDCQAPSGGLATSSLDCIQDCQDKCCDSYEQCSYKLKITSEGGGI